MFTCVHACAPSACGTNGGLKKILDFLEPELHPAMSHCVGAETLSWVLCKYSRALNVCHLQTLYLLYPRDSLIQNPLRDPTPAQVQGGRVLSAPT